VDRAEIAELAGDTARARLYFTRFLQQYDLGGPTLRPLVARAAAGIQRLEP
jgi:hypothetical protein